MAMVSVLGLGQSLWCDGINAIGVSELLYTLLILSIYLFVFSMLRLSAFLVGF
jgi:hypothetical protein